MDDASILASLYILLHSSSRVIRMILICAPSRLLAAFRISVGRRKLCADTRREITLNKSTSIEQELELESILNGSCVFASLPFFLLDILKPRALYIHLGASFGSFVISFHDRKLRVLGGLGYRNNVQVYRGKIERTKSVLIDRSDDDSISWNLMRI